MAKPQFGDILQVKLGSNYFPAQVRGVYKDWREEDILVLLIPGNNMAIQRKVVEFGEYRNAKTHQGDAQPAST